MADIALEWLNGAVFFNPTEGRKTLCQLIRRGRKPRDLPRTKQELTPDQAKHVKGGLASNPAQLNVAMGDGSVRVTDIKDGTSNTLLPAIQKK